MTTGLLPKVRALSVVMLMVVLAASCTSGGTAAGSAKPHAVHVAMVPGGPNAYFAPWGPALASAASTFGLAGHIYEVPPTATFDLTVENSTINSLVSKGYNAFGIFPDDPHGTNGEMKELASRGIPSIALAGCTYQPSPALFCLGTDVEGSAYAETQQLINAIGGHGNIALLTGLLVDPNTTLREAGVAKAVAQTHGAVKLLQVVANIDTPEAAPPAIESLLAAKASQLQGMLSTDYYPSVAAATIFTDNPQYRHIKFIGEDNAPEVMQAIHLGYIYGTMYQNSYGQSYVAAYVLNKVVAHGCKVKSNAPFASTPETNRFVNSGFLFVGRQTVGQFLGKPESIPSYTPALLSKMNSEFLSC